LKDICLVPVVDNAEPNGKYLSSSNDERCEMLLELLDHAIDKHLTDSAQYSHQKHMNYEKMMLENELKYIPSLHQDTRVNKGNNCNPFVNSSHHLHRLGFID
jgi:hypothetical protein